MSESVACAKRKWTFLRIVKGLGPVYLPVGLMTTELIAWVLLTRYGVIRPHWEAWRIVLMLSLLVMVFIVGVYFEKTEYEDYVEAGAGLVPGLLSIVITLLLGFVLQSFVFINIYVAAVVAGLSYLFQCFCALKRVLEPESSCEKDAR